MGNWYHRYNMTLCYPTCPPTGYLYYINGDHVCYNSCTDTSKNKYNVNKQYTCLEKCPSTDPYNVQYLFVCYKKCAETDAKYYIKDQYICYMQCTNSGTHCYYNNGTVLCMRQCRPSAIFHLPGQYSCHAKCPSPTYFHELNGDLCYANCNKTAHNYRYYTNGTIVCLPSCSNDAWYHAQNS